MKHKFSVSIPAIILYSVLLIAVMIGAFYTVNQLLKKSEGTNVTTNETPVNDAVSDQSAELDTVFDETLPTQPAQTVEEPLAEEPLPENLIDLTAIVSAEEYTINYATEHFSPKTRDPKLAWNDTVFSRIENTKNPAEAIVNTYSLTRKWAKREDGNLMEFEVYTNPSTKKIEKITAIEHCGDFQEIIEYYYDNGKINYIAQRRNIIEQPVNITSADVTGRYYFNDDRMVKYSAVEDGIAYEYLAANLNKYSDGAKSQYDYLEKTMINWSYITLNAVPALVETEKIEGYVLDVFNSAMADNEVLLISETTGNVVMKTTTDGNGLYSFIVPINNDDTYIIRARRQTLNDVNIYGVTAISGSSTYYAKTIYLPYTTNVETYNMNISLLDATKNGPLADASLTIREGLDCKSGSAVATVNSNGAGVANATLLAGSYTGEIKKNGYETSYFPIIVKMDHTAVYGYTVPELSDGTYQVVTSWDTPNLDLDALLFTADIPNTKRSASDMQSGPAVESVAFENGAVGTFRYFLSDYTNSIAGDAMNYSFSSSNALITVFSSDGYLTSYSVPAGHGGVLWDVFTLRNGQLLTRGTYYTLIEPDSYWTSK